MTSNHFNLDSITTETEMLNSNKPITNISELLIAPEVRAEFLTDEFITQTGLNSEQLNLDMAFCREFEGE